MHAEMLALFGMLAAAATAAEPTCFLDADNRPPQNVKLRLLQRDWTSHKLITQVASILLTEQLKYDVEVVDAKTAPMNDYQSLATGDVDANFEMWPAGKELMCRRWARDCVLGEGRNAAEHQEMLAVSAGSHAVLSYSAMFVPQYVVDADPTAGFFIHLGKPEAQKQYSTTKFARGEPDSDQFGLCGTPQWNCTNEIWQPPHCKAGGCHAQLLKAHTHYDAGVFEQQIAANRLNISVVYLTTKTLHEAVWNASARRQPILFYGHEPSPDIQGLPHRLFQRVLFSPTSPECLAKARSDPTGGLHCESSPSLLQRIVSPRLALEADAMFFARAFELNYTDYQGLFKHHQYSKSDARLAACRWLHEVGDAKWQPWIKYTKAIPFSIGLTGCWLVFHVQLLVCIVSCLIQVKVPKHLMQLSRRCIAFCKPEVPLSEIPTKNTRSFSDSSEISETSLTTSHTTAYRMQERHKATGIGCFTSMLHIGGSDAVEVPVAILQGKMGFLGFRRTEKRFVEPDEAWLSYHGHAQSQYRFDVSHRKKYVFQYVMTSALPYSLWAALNFSLLAGATGSAAKLWRDHLENNLALHPDGPKNFDKNAMRMKELMTNFSFLPVLMLSISISREALRWIRFIEIVYENLGCLQNIALLVGGSFPNTNTVGKAASERAVQFKFYRYLLAMHLLSFFKVDPRLQDAEQVRSDLVEVKILSESEASRLVHCPEKKMREMVMAWIAGLWHEQVRHGVVAAESTNAFMEQLMEFRRAIIAVEKTPTMFTVMFDLTCRVFFLFIVFAQPVQMLSKQTCIQPWGILVSFFIFFCYHGMITVMRTLEKSPFDPHADCINIDALLCDTEQMIFHSIRQGYGDKRLRHLNGICTLHSEIFKTNLQNGNERSPDSADHKEISPCHVSIDMSLSPRQVSRLSRPCV